jgi:hypothetical protein
MIFTESMKMYLFHSTAGATGSAVGVIYPICGKRNGRPETSWTAKRGKQSSMN